MATHFIMTSSASEDMMPSSLPVRPRPPAGHQLRATINKTGNQSRVTVGEKNPNRPNKSILLVGERAAGKPALIDALVNYSMGLKSEHGVWFQVVEEVEKSQSVSQTPDVIVYQIFEVKNQTLPFSLTIIDTPGYGDSRGVQHDDEVSNSLLNMFQTRDGAPDLHAVGLVMKATDDRVSDRLKYVFNSVVSLFGAGNTVALITHSDGMPPHNALKALEEANITCSKNNKNQSVHFVFNNQKMTQRTQENLFGLETAWRVSLNGLTAFAQFLHAAQPNDLTATFQVLAERARLTACVQNLQERIRFTELKQRDVRLTQEELHKHTEERKSQQLIITVTEAFKDTEPIRTGSSGSVLEAAVCCPVCEENCHYPGCTMGLRAQHCEVMKDGVCTSCTNKCPASYHVKDNLKYVIRTRKVQLTEAEVAQTCGQNQNQAAGGIRSGLIENLEKQMQQLAAERTHLLDRAYQHVVQLGQTRPVTVNSGSTHVLLDFLINKMKQKGDEAKVKKLEEMDKKMDDRTRAELLDKMTCITSDYEDLISDSFPVHPGPPAVYQMRTKKEKFGTLTRVSVGQKDVKKPNKTVLLVGETGAGKSTLVNALVNYSMGVKFEDEVWFQIVEEEDSQTESQTLDVTVYQVFDGQTLPFSLTVIDTPGFGNSRGISWDVTIRGKLLELFQSDGGVHEIHAVGLVVKASDNRLSDRLMYIYDSVMSLFGKNMEKHIVALITHSDLKTPEHVLQTLQAAGIRCAKDGKNRPVHFLLDAKQTLQREPAERAAALRYSWDFSYRQMDHLTQYLTTSKPQNLATTVEVLGDRIRLTACTQNLKEKIQLMELKQTEIRQTEEAVRSHEEEMRRSQSFTVEVDEEYKERRHLNGGMWGLVFYNGAVSCCHCEKTCHFPCTVTWYPATCEVMRNGHCSVCCCHSSAHVKQEWVYQSRTRRVQKILEDVKRRYEFNQGEWMKKRNLLQNLETEKGKLSAEKSQLTDEAYYHVVRLEQIALRDQSLSTFVHLDFLIGQIKEKKDVWKVQKLEEMRRRYDGDQMRSGLRYMASHSWSTKTGSEHVGSNEKMKKQNLTVMRDELHSYV